MKRLLLLLMSIVFSLVLSELMVRVSGYVPYYYDREMYVQTKNALLPYALHPVYSGYYAGGKITIDKDGYRRIPCHPYRNKYSDVNGTSYPILLMLGDSGLFGQGLDDNDTVPCALQNYLREKHIMVRVRAISVPGYTSWNEYAAVMKYPYLNRVLRIFVWYDPNDITLDNDSLKLAYGQMSILGKSRWHSVTQWMYKHIYISQIAAIAARYLLKEKTHLKARPFMPQKNKKALKYSLEALKRIKMISDKKGIPMAVGLYRGINFYYQKNYALLYENEMNKSLNRNGIQSFPLTLHTENLSMDEAKVTLNDPHPSARAAHLIAYQIFRELKKREFFD